MERDQIVVWDPKGEWWQGGVVDPARARALAAEGVVMLPVRRQLLESNGALGGFFFRAWGSGWPLQPGPYRMVCPLALRVRAVETAQVDPPTTLSWVARLVPGDDVELHEDGRYVGQGIVRLAFDSAQPGAFGGGVSPTDKSAVDVAQLGKPDANGGWTIRGEALLTPVSDMTVGLGLYCSAPGLRVAWAAVSQS